MSLTNKYTFNETLYFFSKDKKKSALFFPFNGFIIAETVSDSCSP